MLTPRDGVLAVPHTWQRFRLTWEPLISASLTLPTWIPFRFDALPDQFFCAVRHDDPLRNFCHRAAAAAAYCIESGRANRNAWRIRTIELRRHKKGVE